MKKPLSILFAALAALLCTACGSSGRVCSPDGTLCREVAERGGRIGYSVTRRGAPLLDFSTLGFELLDAPALREGLEITGTSRDSRDETWETVWGEQRTVRSHYNELRVSVRESDAPRRRFDVVFRLFDDGYGFRFEFPEQPHLGEFAITDELTEYRFPSDHNAWWMPAREPYYESLARHTPISRMDTVNTPLTLECAGGGYLALHEADLTDYAKMSLYPDGTTLRCHLTPWSTGGEGLRTDAFPHAVAHDDRRRHAGRSGNFAAHAQPQRAVPHRGHLVDPPRQICRHLVVDASLSGDLGAGTPPRRHDRKRETLH